MKIESQTIAENLRNWIAALRSGEYTQGKNYLRTNGDILKYCCLGVMCDISNRGDWEGEGFRLHKTYSLHVATPPVILCEMFGIKDKTLGLGLLEINRLVNMNDWGKTFEEIADYLEKEILSRYG